MLVGLIETGIILFVLRYVIKELRYIRTNHLEGIYGRLRKVEIKQTRIETIIRAVYGKVFGVLYDDENDG